MTDELQPVTSPLDSPLETVMACQNNVGVRKRRASFVGNDEPTLNEMLDDDIMQTLMTRDGVNPRHVMTLMDVMRDRLR